MTSVYDNERLAAAYAFDRPPVHARILRSVRLEQRARRALDVGCGAGASTAALAPLAEHVVGLEPVPLMLAHRHEVAPDARFVVGSAEELPFAAASFDLVAAAGSLNYTDLPSALVEVARVLTPGGTFLLYDFEGGRHSLAGDALATWFTAFEQRFPWPSGWQPLDVRALPLATFGLRMLDYTDLEIRLPMTHDAYLRYALSEVNVHDAVARGACWAEEAREWCRETLGEVFGGGEVTVVFRGYLATLARQSGQHERHPRPTT
ncbi:class I SAM-dependent methyltransferase [Micromonospora humi]|uniref:Methyltransferase domain-containing protein n=1 Tax=Micromonospora humi TaxID=745366 RepID=A0A1C5IS61_9ACTN|nr:class I SAM-dependent methyltransferase [Micromonospora humi]SCG60606.1 Methyltransferase domain-containing protein [Micromonospora humi]